MNIILLRPTKYLLASQSDMYNFKCVSALFSKFQ